MSTLAGETHPLRFLQQENARLTRENQLLTDEVQALRRYVRVLQRLQHIIHRFTPEQDILSLLDQTLQSAMTLLDATDASLMLIDEESDELVFVLVHGAVRETLPGYRIDRQEGIAGWAAEHNQPVVVNNVRADPRFLPEPDERFHFETHSLIAVPLTARGKVLGVIEVLNKRSREGFTNDEASLLSILATLSASALDYAASVETETK